MHKLILVSSSDGACAKILRPMPYSPRPMTRPLIIEPEQKLRNAMHLTA